MKCKASDNIQDLTGQGLEFLMDKFGNVRLEFFNGNIVRSKPSGNTADTIIPLPDDKAIEDIFKTAEPDYIPLGMGQVIYVDFINECIIFKGE